MGAGIGIMPPFRSYALRWDASFQPITTGPGGLELRTGRCVWQVKVRVADRFFMGVKLIDAFLSVSRQWGCGAVGLFFSCFGAVGISIIRVPFIGLLDHDLAQIGL